MVDDRGLVPVRQHERDHAAGRRASQQGMSERSGLRVETSAVQRTSPSRRGRDRGTPGGALQRVDGLHPPAVGVGRARASRIPAN
jgi:hypothetical protein